MLLAVWEYYLSHFTEINWAIIFALFFAVLMDFIQPASKLMAVRRHIMNKLAEQSVASLRVRIAQAQGQRDQVANYLASDKALYLSVVKYVLGIVLMLSAAAAVVLLGHLGIMRGPYELLALAPVLMSIVLAVYGIRTASWDEAPKISKVVGDLHAEIAAMKSKLTQKLKPGNDGV